MVLTRSQTKLLLLATNMDTNEEQRVATILTDQMANQIEAEITDGQFIIGATVGDEGTQNSLSLDDMEVTAIANENEVVAVEGSKRSRGKLAAVDEIGNVSISFHLDMLSVTMARLRVQRHTPPPLIPLCRILSHKAIRTVGQERLRMKRIYREDGYLMEKGDFILSMATSSGQSIFVRDHVKVLWDVEVDSDDDVEETEQWDFDDFQRCHLPSYAEGMARTLQRQRDKGMHSSGHKHRSCIFVDDECQEDTS